jgi:hypothetical protein
MRLKELFWRLYDGTALAVDRWRGWVTFPSTEPSPTTFSIRTPARSAGGC